MQWSETEIRLEECPVNPLIDTHIKSRMQNTLLHSIWTQRSRIIKVAESAEKKSVPVHGIMTFLGEN